MSTMVERKMGKKQLAQGGKKGAFYSSPTNYDRWCCGYDNLEYHIRVSIPASLRGPQMVVKPILNKATQLLEN
jgi:hypothetical protein